MPDSMIFVIGILTLVLLFGGLAVSIVEMRSLNRTMPLRGMASQSPIQGGGKALDNLDLRQRLNRAAADFHSAEVEYQAALRSSRSGREVNRLLEIYRASGDQYRHVLNELLGKLESSAGGPAEE